MLLDGFFEICIALSSHNQKINDAFFIQYQFVFPILIIVLLLRKIKYLKLFILIALVLILLISILFQDYLYILSNSEYALYCIFLFFLVSIGLTIKAITNYRNPGIQNYILILLSWAFIANLVTLLTLNQVIEFNMIIWNTYFIYFLLYFTFLRLTFILAYGRRIFKK